MVVAENNADGIFVQRFFEDDSGVGYSACDTAFAYEFEMLYFIGAVKKNNPKDFVAVVFQD